MAFDNILQLTTSMKKMKESFVETTLNTCTK